MILFLNKLQNSFAKGVIKIDFIEVAKGRRSIRHFLPEPVPEEDIEQIIQIGTSFAPSAGNRQDWRIKAILHADVKRKMREFIQSKALSIAEQAGEDSPEAYSHRHNSTFFADAPAALVILSKPYKSKTVELMEICGYSQAEIDYLLMRPDLQTIGGLIQTILLAAYTLNYGSCWMVAPNIARHELEKFLKVESPWSIAAIVAIGRYEKKKASKKLKDLSEILEIIR
jgi:nitroreductase